MCNEWKQASNVAGHLPRAAVQQDKVFAPGLPALIHIFNHHIMAFSWVDLY